MISVAVTKSNLHFQIPGRDWRWASGYARVEEACGCGPRALVLKVPMEEERGKDRIQDVTQIWGGSTWADGGAIY